MGLKEEIEWLKRLLDDCYNRGTGTDRLFIKAVIRYAKGMCEEKLTEEDEQRKSPTLGNLEPL